MVISQGLRITKLTNFAAKNFLLLNERNNLNKQVIRLSHDAQFYYRKYPPPYPKKDYFIAECVTGFVWWWILHNCFTNYHELTGVTFPDPSKWTDEELGIPPEED